MNKYRHSPFDEEIVDAMITHNKDKPSSEKFTLVDARIISLIHSYGYNHTPFYASNEYLAQKCFTTPSTVQKSINRLYNHDLIEKKVSCTNGKKQRLLSYNEQGADKFKAQYKETKI